MQAPGNGPPYLDLGRDDHIDGHVVAAEKVSPDRLEIALVPYARNLGRHVEQRMGNLAGHHVDFIGIGDSDDHIRVIRTSSLKCMGVRSETLHGFDVHGIRDFLDQFRRAVDDGNVVILRNQMPDDTRSHLAGSTDYYLHTLRLSPRFSMCRHERHHVPVFSRSMLSAPRPSIFSFR